jgi:hypothetical protein
MESSGPRLGDLTKGRIYRGVVTGANEAFIVKKETHDLLLSEHKSSAELIKPVVAGDDIRRGEVHWREEYLLYIRWDTEIKRYPAVLRHLQQHKAKLSARPEVGEGRFPWYALSRYASDFADVFDHNKILYPEIARESRFAMDTAPFYLNKTVFCIPSEDWYLVGILNSAAAWEFLKSTCPVLGDEDNRGRLTLQDIYLQTLPIPDSSAKEREFVAGQAREAQRLHGLRRKRVEKFLRDLGTSPAESSSRNPLEQPWALTPAEFTRRAGRIGQAGTPNLRVFTAAGDETAALTEAIGTVEREIDARVTALYGL